MLTKKFCYLRTNDFDDLVVCENLVYNKKKRSPFGNRPSLRYLNLSQSVPPYLLSILSVLSVLMR